MMDITDLSNLCKSKLKLTDSEEGIFQIPSELWEKGRDSMEHALVGRVISKRQIHLDSFKQAMEVSWNPRKQMDLKIIGSNRFVVTFNHAVDKSRVMTRGPWAFDKNLVIVKPITDGMDPTQVPLNNCDFYVHVEGLPFLMRKRIFAEFIGNKIGTFIEHDSEHDKGVSRVTMRIRVEIDISKALRRIVKVQAPDGTIHTATLSL